MDTQALRQKILDLAIRGKLVPQDPNDEPASVLLERICAEKQQMVKDGKLKPKDIKNDTIIFKGEDNLHYEKFQDGTVKCIEDEIPFEVPEGWAWARLNTFCPYGECEKVDSKNISDDAWILDLEDIEKDTGKIIQYVLKGTRNSISTKNKFFQGQLLYSKLRPYLNKVVIAPQDGYCTSEILPLTLCGNILPSYMQLYLMSNVFLSYVDILSYGVKMPRLGTEDGKRSLIALPPLKEQQRIVSKAKRVVSLIDSLMSDKIRISNSITGIKTKILNLAIQGKLVPQDSDDEPASVLLERMRAEKEELIKQGKIKRDKNASIIFKGDDNSYYEKMNEKVVCIDEEIRFNIPKSWEWVRLGTLFMHNTGKALNSSNSEGVDLTYITTSNVYWNKFELNNLKTMRFTDSELDKCTIAKGDLLVCEGGDIGRSAIWNLDEPMRIQNHVHRLRAYIPLETELYLFTLYLYKSIGIIVGNGIGLQGLSSNRLHSILVPLPPLAEQKRIVAKIKKIINYLDSIEQRIG